MISESIFLKGSLGSKEENSPQQKSPQRYFFLDNTSIENKETKVNINPLNNFKIFESVDSKPIVQYFKYFVLADQIIVN